MVHDLSSDHAVEEGEVIPLDTPSGHVTEGVKSSGHVTDDKKDKNDSHVKWQELLGLGGSTAKSREVQLNDDLTISVYNIPDESIEKLFPKTPDIGDNVLA